MKGLIQEVKAETEKVLEALDADDQYQKQQLERNERAREVAKHRIRACDKALDRIEQAEKSLTEIR